MHFLPTNQNLKLFGGMRFGHFTVLIVYIKGLNRVHARFESRFMFKTARPFYLSKTFAMTFRGLV